MQLSTEKSLILPIASGGRRRENIAVATPEGELVRKWREFKDLTQEQLGEMCDPPIGKSTISDKEGGDSSMSVATLLKIISALRVPGADAEHQLARFFLGPEEASILEAIDAAKRSEQALRSAERSLRELLSGHARRR